MSPILTAGIGQAVQAVGSIADDLFTSDEERAKSEVDIYKAETERLSSQTKVNEIEAANNSTWRPMIGRICGYGFAYAFIIYPMLTWVWQLSQALGWIPMGFMPPPEVGVEPLWVLATGMLGLGGARMVEKIKGKS